MFSEDSFDKYMSYIDHHLYDNGIYRHSFMSERIIALMSKLRPYSISVNLHTYSIMVTWTGGYATGKVHTRIL